MGGRYHTAKIQNQWTRKVGSFTTQGGECRAPFALLHNNVKPAYSQGNRVYGTFGGMHTSSKLFLSLVSVLALGCTGADGKIGAAGENGTSGEDGTSVLVSTSAEAAGDNCATGGIKLESGTDTNDDGVLDAGEITDTQYVCNGDGGGDGLQSLIATTPLPVDGTCVFGGIQVDYGIDDNDDGTLDSGEIDGSDDLCNACPYNPAVFVKDFAALASSDTALLDMDQVAVTGTGGNVNIIATSGLGVLGSATPEIDVGEALTFTFDQPVYNLSYTTTVSGATGNRDIEAFDADAQTLGTVSDAGNGTNAVSSEFGDVGILSMVDTATADSHNISGMEFTFCP